MILFIKLLLAFCSIAYELILAQAMTAFLENTVLRYSVTIGLYLFAMGLGTLFIDRRMRSPWRVLWLTEVALTVIGGLSVISLFFVDHLSGARVALLLWTHGLVIVIGFLTGFELPLLLKIAEDIRGLARNKLIAVDYAGGFLGSLAFVFLFYPRTGIITATLLIALINALSGVLILRYWSVKDGRPAYAGWVQAGLLVLLIGALFFSSGMEKALVHLYTGV